jgi:hypothetical protein
MNDSRPGENPPPSKKWKLLLGIALAVALIVAAKFFNVQGILKNALESIASLGPWGPVAFILIYIVATVLFITGSLFRCNLRFFNRAIFNSRLGFPADTRQSKISSHRHSSSLRRMENSFTHQAFSYFSV